MRFSGATQLLLIGSPLRDTGIVSFSVPILQMRKLRFRKVNQFLQDQLIVSRASGTGSQFHLL